MFWSMKWNITLLLTGWHANETPHISRDSGKKVSVNSKFLWSVKRSINSLLTGWNVHQLSPHLSRDSDKKAINQVTQSLFWSMKSNINFLLSISSPDKPLR